MALSERNSNTIVVNDSMFRWTVAGRSQGLTNLVTVVVQATSNGSRLAVEIPCIDPYLNTALPRPEYSIRSITPKLVRHLIDEARSAGWNPAECGRQFDVSAVVASMRGEAGETCHACWQCPFCSESYSEDVEFGSEPPMFATCGRTRHHNSGQVGNFMLFW